METTEIFDLAVKLNQFKYEAKTYLEFMDFLQIARIYYYFSEYEVPFVDGVLEKKDLVRAINDQVTPTFFTPSLVDTLFNAAGTA